MTMQGEELKALRREMGLTQEALADRLGLSATYVGLMERDAKPIEPRTEMTVRYLAGGGDAPIRIAVGTFGDQFVVITTEAGPGGRRNHRVRAPAFDSADDAIATAREIAEKEGCPFVSTIC